VTAGVPTMSRILLSTHGGHGADGAVHVAGQLAQRRQAKLDILAVLVPYPALEAVNLGGIAGMGLVSTPEQLEGLSEVLRDSVATQLQRCRVTGDAPVLRIGPVAPVVADAARAAGADLIVVGLGPHDIVNRALGGETALQLVQLATTPVLAVPAAATAPAKRVVAAIDFTATSVRAARAAARCLAAGDVLELVHVSPNGLPSDQDARLRELASQLAAPSGVEVVAVELHGEPAPSLLAYVDSTDADMIALGSHGYGLWKRLALGSVVSKVVRLAKCAVLVAPIGSISVPG
jgi:nucleotide-binding universal stress UspA family protein